MARTGARTGAGHARPCRAQPRGRPGPEFCPTGDRVGHPDQQPRNEAGSNHITVTAPPPIQLGLNLPYVEGSMDGRAPRWADIVAMAQAAERVGFESIWVSDHVGFGDPDGDWSGAWESWTHLHVASSSLVSRSSTSLF